jgi:hypothetical protein
VPTPRFLATLAFLSLSVLPKLARADLSAGIFAGTAVPSKSDGDDLFRLGLGARAGYSFPIPIYIGAATTFHMGSKDDGEGAANRLSYHTLELGLELKLAAFGVRPYTFAGAAKVTSTRDIDGGFWSPCYGLGIAPWWSFLRTPVIDAFIGLDIRAISLTHLLENGDTQQGITRLPIYLQAGVRL